MSENIKRKTVREWLEQMYQWRIPVYQRHYSWDASKKYGPTQLFLEVVKEQAEIRLAGQARNGKPPTPHYFGAILVENKTERLPETTHSYDVVDGQQRLTTINVALFSLIGLAGKKGFKEKVKDELAQYIFTDTENRKNPKLLPTNFDKTQYNNLLYQAYDESEPDIQNRGEYYGKSMVVKAFEFFNERFKEFVEDPEKGDEAISLMALQEALLDGFELVVIALEKYDEAQKVFESINNTARPLTTFDLIRNNIFYRADKQEPGLDVELFESDIWKQFETPFWESDFNKKGGEKHIEVYIARMLVAKRKELLQLKRDSIFQGYKDFTKMLSDEGIYVKKEITEISEYVNVYKFIVDEARTNPVSPDFDFGYFKDRHVNTVVFLPIIFIIATCNASESEKQRMINLLESWYIRRSVCDLQEGDYNRQVPEVCKKLSIRPSYAELDNFLKESETNTKIFPRNEKVTTTLRGLNFYKQKKIARYVFERIIQHTTSKTKREWLDIQNLSIDHIFPQSWRGRDEWKTSSQGQDEGTVDVKINTIGNLTPMAKGINSEKSNRPWIVENGKGARDCLADSSLKMTCDIAKKDSWTIKDIDERTEDLAKIICEIWPYDIK